MLNDIDEELRLTRKALLIACMKLGFAQDTDDEEYDTEEETLAVSMYKQYTRPKKIAHKMLELAKTNRYNLQTHITIDYWDKEVKNRTYDEEI